MSDFENICKMLNSSEDCTCYDVVERSEVFGEEYIGVKVISTNGVELVFHAGLEELITVRPKPEIKIKYTGRKV